MGVCVMFAWIYGRRQFSRVFATIERSDIGQLEVPIFVSLLGLGIGTMLANFYMWGIMFLLRAVVYMLVRKVSQRGPMCFRCLMLRLSGPSELLFLLCCIAFWTWVVVSDGTCMFW